MDYLNYVFEKLKFSFYIVFESNTKKKKEIRISNKNITVNVITYLIFAFVINVFFCISLIGEFEINKFIKLFKNKNILIYTLIIFILVTTYGLIKRHIITKIKETKPLNNNLYNRELPSNLTPAHVRILVYDGLIDSETLACTILDLIDRNYLKLEKSNKNDIFTKEIYIYKTDKEQNELFDYEKYLINWFFTEEKTSSIELQKKLNSIEENPSEKFAIFEGLLLLSFPLNKYYKNYNNDKKRKFYALCFTLFFPFILIVYLSTNIYIYYICKLIVLYGLVNMTICSITYILNDKGVELRNNYINLKRFLQDFSLIHEQTSEMISIWNYYLSYSIAIGINGIAYDEINNFFGNNIYNINNNKPLKTEEREKLINDIPNVIERSEKLYQERKI